MELKTRKNHRNYRPVPAEADLGRKKTPNLLLRFKNCGVGVTERGKRRFWGTKSNEHGGRDHVIVRVFAVFKEYSCFCLCLSEIGRLNPRIFSPFLLFSLFPNISFFRDCLTKFYPLFWSPIFKIYFLWTYF